LTLWREKRGEVEPADLSGNLTVQLGSVTEDLNRRWFQRNTGQALKDVQRRVRHPTIRFLARMYGPAVRCKRFRRAVGCGLASMYPAFDWSICSGPSWISARMRSH